MGKIKNWEKGSENIKSDGTKTLYYKSKRKPKINWFVTGFSDNKGKSYIVRVIQQTITRGKYPAEKNLFRKVAKDFTTAKSIAVTFMKKHP